MARPSITVVGRGTLALYLSVLLVGCSGEVEQESRVLPADALEKMVRGHRKTLEAHLQLVQAMVDRVDSAMGDGTDVLITDEWRARLVDARTRFAAVSQEVAAYPGDLSDEKALDRAGQLRGEITDLDRQFTRLRADLIPPPGGRK